MNTGAVIVAAGKSSRMGNFKPMLRLGPCSVAQHVVNAFQQAGITKIAMVTGRGAEELMTHLAGNGITFLHNAEYLTTEMFDSAKIGLSYMMAQCDRVLFTPVDIPLFSPRTVKALTDTQALLACPVCNGKQGHPLMLSSTIIRTILTDSGEGGLKGAISRLGIPMTRVEVDDPGVLHDADTPEEFQRLLDYYQQAVYPSDTRMNELLTQTPQPVRAHSEAVAVKAALLAGQIHEKVNLALLQAACLLHDMAKTEGKTHPALAAQRLRQEGYTELAGIVTQHHDLTQNPSIEAQLLYLADKLVKGTEDVSLEERFSASRQKCQTPEAMEHWERRYRDARGIAARYHLDV